MSVPVRSESFFLAVERSRHRVAQHVDVLVAGAVRLDRVGDALRAVSQIAHGTVGIGVDAEGRLYGDVADDVAAFGERRDRRGGLALVHHDLAAVIQRVVAALFVGTFGTIADRNENGIGFRGHTQRLAQFRISDDVRKVASKIGKARRFEFLAVDRYADRGELFVERCDQRIDVRRIFCDVAHGVDPAARDLLDELQGVEFRGAVRQPLGIVDVEHAEHVLQGARPGKVAHAEQSADRRNDADQERENDRKHAPGKAARHVTGAGEDLPFFDKLFFERDLLGVGGPARLFILAHAVSLFSFTMRKTPPP